MICAYVMKRMYIAYRIYRLEEAETEQNHGQPNESFCTHTQIFLLSLMNIHWWNREYANLHK